MSTGAFVAGTDPHVIAVADAGPLIHLDELDSLDLLADFASVLVPDAVWNEVQRHRPRALDGSRCRLERQAGTSPQEPDLAAMFRALSLDLGEREALACVRDHPGAILLTDDAAARLAARALQVPVHGSIGILLRAIRRRQRTREEVLDLLRSIPVRSTLHIRPSLLHEIIGEVEKSGG
ncbi:MAG: DNA-binding protein [Acidobacteriota bacterium]